LKQEERIKSIVNPFEHMQHRHKNYLILPNEKQTRKAFKDVFLKMMYCRSKHCLPTAVHDNIPRSKWV